MTSHTVDTLQIRAARLAGVMFLLAFIIPTLNWAFVLSRMIVAGDAIATANNIMANQLSFRVGISIELVMSLFLVVLATALYVLLKPVNRNLALLALFLKLTEAAIATAIVTASFIALQIANDGMSLTGLGPEHMRAPVGMILNAHTDIWAVPMVVLGLDMMLFCYLLLKSKYVPGMLAGFGIVSFALILIGALVNILVPQYSTTAVAAICWTPSGLFELAIGTWLLSKGIKAG